MQAYSDPKRETDPWALPDLEVFKVTMKTPTDECPLCCLMDAGHIPDGAHTVHCGWYYQCLPGNDEYGPYDSAETALEAAREDAGAYDEEEEQP